MIWRFNSDDFGSLQRRNGLDDSGLAQGALANTSAIQPPRF